MHMLMENIPLTRAFLCMRIGDGASMFSLIAKLTIKGYKNHTDPHVRRQYGMLSGILGIALNALLFTIKYFAGVISGSIAITADAFNNLSDAGSSLITFFGFMLAGKKADREHPFGHGRFEYVAAFIVSLLILLMSYELAKASLGKILRPEPIGGGWLVMGILFVSILTKMYMYFYNHRYGKKLDSSAMQATATDSLSDTVSTLVVLLATGAASVFSVNIDGWFGALVALFILYAGIRSSKETLSMLLGHQPSPDLVKAIEQTVLSHREVIGIHDLMIHEYGPGSLIISLHAEMPGDQDVFRLHDTLDRIEMELRDKYGCEPTIHMDPIETNDSAVTQMRMFVAQTVREVNASYQIHDFRMVTGPTHKNLIFDLVIPLECRAMPSEIRNEVSRRVKAEKPDCYCVIKIEYAYVTDKQENKKTD